MSKDLSPAYVAGFFDGEGCILIHKESPHREKRTGYYLQVTLGNTDRRVLDFLHQQFGGNVYEHKVDRRKRRPMFYWNSTSETAKQFIEWIRPHLVLKAIQAWLALEFLASRGLGGGRGRPLDDEGYAIREGFYLALQTAKRI